MPAAVGIRYRKAHEHKLRALFGRCQRVLYRVRRNVIVRIDEHHIVRVLTDRLNAAVARDGRAGIRDAHKVQPGLVLRERRHHRSGIVPRSVIHHYELKVAVGLSEHAVHGVLYILFCVVGRDYYRNLCFHRIPPCGEGRINSSRYSPELWYTSAKYSYMGMSLA